MLSPLEMLCEVPDWEHFDSISVRFGAVAGFNVGDEKPPRLLLL
jgi:hypothetical protein